MIFEEILEQLQDNLDDSFATIAAKGGEVPVERDFSTIAEAIETVPPTVHVESVTVSPATADLALNATRQFSATILPVDATDKSGTWTSSNPTVVSVNQNGVATALAVGNATITFTATDGGVTGSATVATRIAVTGVSVSPASVTVEVGSTQQLTATVSPSNATNKTVGWVSSNPNVATVNGSGLVSVVGSGSATITAQTQDGGFTATSAITGKVSVASVTVSPATATVNVGSTQQLTVAFTPAGATDKTGTWTSSNPSIATVDNTGLVTAVAAGSATITFTSHDGNKTSSSAITAQAVALGTTVSYYSVWNTSYAVDTEMGMGAENCTVNSINQATFAQWVEDNQLEDMFEWGGVDFNYQRMEEPDWENMDPETGESQMIVTEYWTCWGMMGEIQIEASDMVSTTGIDVTVTDPEMGFAMFRIGKTTVVDKTSTVLTVTVDDADIQNLCAEGDYQRPWNMSLGGQTVWSDAIKSVTMSNALEEVPDYFLAGTGVESVTFSSNAAFIGSYVLSDCSSLNSPITIPASVDTINDYFLGAYYKQNMSFNSTITFQPEFYSIGHAFLRGCKNFNQPITLPEGLTDIGANFLSGCTSFNKPITLPESCNQIGQYFLADCTSFNSAIDFGGISTLREYCLSGCTSFNQSITFSDKLRSVDIVLESYSRIKGYFLNGARNFNSPITLPSQTAMMPPNFLNGCTSFNNTINYDEDYMYYIWDGFLRGCTSFNQSLKISHVKKIGSYFLSGCTRFNQPVTIPTTCWSIGSYFLSNIGQMGAFKSPITFASPNIANPFSIGDHFLYENWHYNHPLVLPERITTIGSDFMAHMYSFNQPITFPNTLTSLGDYAFSQNTMFNSAITFESGNDSVGLAVGGYFLYGSSNYVQSITFPARMSSLGSGTLLTSGVRQVEFLGPVPSGATGDNRSFCSSGAYKNLTATTFTGDYAADWANLFPDMTALSMCRKISNNGGPANFVTWADSEMTAAPSHTTYFGDDEIDKFVHKGTWSSETINSDTIQRNNIREINLGNSRLTTLKDYVFHYCQRATKIVLPPSLTAIPNYFFYQNYYAPLTECAIPSGVKTIGNYFMSEGYQVNFPLNLPAGLTTIGSYFLNAGNNFNQPVTIPSSVTSIGVTFMNNCYAMVSTLTVEAPATVASSGNYTFGSMDQTAACYTTGITLAGTYAQAWHDRFPDRTSNPYRKTLVATS